MANSRILLVDDNDDVRSMYQQGLESHGFQVVPASNVNQALSLIATEKFDVLLSDLHMPDAGDGFTVVSAMRHTQPWSGNTGAQRLPRPTGGHDRHSLAGRRSPREALWPG